MLHAQSSKRNHVSLSFIQNVSPCQPQLLGFPHNVALPVCKLLLFLNRQNPIPPKIALTNQSSMLMRSIHTAFFMREIPPSAPAFSLMYSDPKRPKTATQRMNRMASQPKRMAALKELKIKGRTAKIRAVMALRTAMAVAKPCGTRDQLATLLRRGCASLPIGCHCTLPPCGLCSGPAHTGQQLRGQRRSEELEGRG